MVHQLMYMSLTLKDVSLYHGKMGMVMALYAYSQRHHHENVEEFAWDLLQDIYGSIHDALPYGLEWGLSGIGYGVTFLKRHGILDGSLNDVLSDVDRKIMSYDPRRLTDFSFRTGACGIYCYLRERMAVEGCITSMDKQYIDELQGILVKNHVGRHLIGQNIMDDIQNPSWEATDYLGKDVGIENGLSYYILREAIGESAESSNTSSTINYQ